MRIPLSNGHTVDFAWNVCISLLCVAGSMPERSSIAVHLVLNARTIQAKSGCRLTPSWENSFLRAFSVGNVDLSILWKTSININNQNLLSTGLFRSPNIREICLAPPRVSRKLFVQCSGCGKLDDIYFDEGLFVSFLFIDTCAHEIVCNGSALPVRTNNFVYRPHLLSGVSIIARQLRSLDLILAVCNAVFVSWARFILRARRCDSFKTGDGLSEIGPSPLLPFRTIAVCLLNPYSCKHAISRARCNQIINPARVRVTTQRSLQPAIKLKHLSG